MATLLTGTVTLLFTAIQDSTRLWAQHPRARQTALAPHHALRRQAIAAYAGSVFQSSGAACCAACSSAPRPAHD